MDPSKFPKLESKGPISKSPQRSSRSLFIHNPSTQQTHKDRKMMVFTPMFKRISWNKYHLRNDLYRMDSSDLGCEVDLKSNRKCKHTSPFEGYNKKCELAKEKPLVKHSPARFINLEVMEKRNDIKLINPNLESDLKLIKDINIENIEQLFEKNKMLRDWKYSCRNEFKSQRGVKKVHFHLV